MPYQVNKGWVFFHEFLLYVYNPTFSGARPRCGFVIFPRPPFPYFYSNDRRPYRQPGVALAVGFALKTRTTKKTRIIYTKVFTFIQNIN